mmetsp:Transcript_4094/g.18571  ORF Transcript_4094/g.18571 Transcript_4094/m.18571 type:complete len:254 (-) Transcript_4094:16-777(-)
MVTVSLAANSRARRRSTHRSPARRRRGRSRRGRGWHVGHDRTLGLGVLHSVVDVDLDGVDNFVHGHLPASHRRGYRRGRRRGRRHVLHPRRRPLDLYLPPLHVPVGPDGRLGRGDAQVVAAALRPVLRQRRHRPRGFAELDPAVGAVDPDAHDLAVVPKERGEVILGDLLARVHPRRAPQPADAPHVDGPSDAIQILRGVLGSRGTRGSAARDAVPVGGLLRGHTIARRGGVPLRGAVTVPVARLHRALRNDP